MNFTPAIALLGEPTAQHWSLTFVDGKLLLPEPDNEPLAPLNPQAHPHVHDWLQQAQARHYLGQLDGTDCWALRLATTPSGWRPVSLRAAMMGLPAPLAGLASRAAQVLDWTAHTAGAAPAAHPPSTRPASVPAAAPPVATPLTRASARP